MNINFHTTNSSVQRVNIYDCKTFLHWSIVLQPYCYLIDVTSFWNAIRTKNLKCFFQLFSSKRVSVGASCDDWKFQILKFVQVVWTQTRKHFNCSETYDTKQSIESRLIEQFRAIFSFSFKGAECPFVKFNIKETCFNENDIRKLA